MEIQSWLSWMGTLRSRCIFYSCPGPMGGMNWDLRGVYIFFVLQRLKSSREWSWSKTLSLLCSCCQDNQTAVVVVCQRCLQAYSLNHIVKRRIPTQFCLFGKKTLGPNHDPNKAFHAPCSEGNMSVFGQILLTLCRQPTFSEKKTPHFGPNPPFWTVFRPVSMGMAKKDISNTKDIIFC